MSDTTRAGKSPSSLTARCPTAAIRWNVSSRSTRPGYHEAWSLPLLRERGTIEAGEIVLKWEAGQTSALDKGTIAGGRDIVVVQRQQGRQLSDIPYDVTFAFSFHAFRPDSPIHKSTSAGPEN